LKGSLVVVGMNHRTAPVEMRERLAVSPSDLHEAAAQLKALPHVREAMLVATCNRVEAYVASDESGGAAQSVRQYFASRAPGAGVGECLYEHRNEAAVRHLFRVAASLDSMVVGEPQILGQVKEALAAARAAGAVGPSLSRTLDRALAAAKRVRSETGIATGSVSVASVAVDLATQIFGDLHGRRMLLVGAGKMAMGAVRSLAQRGAKLSIANRNYERAVELAKAHHADSHPLENLPLLLQHVDVVLCSTGASRFVLTQELVQTAMKARKGRSLFLIDISVPRNVDPRVHGLDNVYLFDVDDLEREVARALGVRGGALERAETILEEELKAFETERRAGTAVPTVTALRDRFRMVARAELEKSMGGKLKHLGADERKAIETMLDAVTNKLLHAPTTALRQGATSPDGAALAAITRMLFQLDEAETHGRSGDHGNAPADVAGSGEPDDEGTDAS
jgi:glutamyl-tRNA reductase